MQRGRPSNIILVLHSSASSQVLFNRFDVTPIGSIEK